MPLWLFYSILKQIGLTTISYVGCLMIPQNYFCYKQCLRT